MQNTGLYRKVSVKGIRVTCFNLYSRINKFYKQQLIKNPAFKKPDFIIKLNLCFIPKNIGLHVQNSPDSLCRNYPERHHKNL